MREIRTEIFIETTSKELWRTLTGFSSYPEWNPFIKSIEIVPAGGGDREKSGRQGREGASLKAGTNLVLSVEAVEGHHMTVKGVVTRVEPKSELRWSGYLLHKSLFSNEHIFEIEYLPESDNPDSEGRPGVMLTHREVYRGLLLPLLWKGLNVDTRGGIEAMNEALKRLLEKGKVGEG